MTPSDHTSAAGPTWRDWDAACSGDMYAGVPIIAFVCVRALIQTHRNSVFPIFADAGQNWIEGKDLYDEHFFELSIDQYRYSPLVTVLFVPFSLLPLEAGGVVWRLLNVALFLGGFLWFCRDVFPGWNSHTMNCRTSLIRKSTIEWN